MSIFENPDTLQQLKNLLNSNNDQDNSGSDTDEELPQQRECFQKRLVNDEGKNKYKTDAHKPLLKEKTIENIEEWQETQEKEDMELLDTRKQPEYKIIYQQSIGTEDVFLQMGNRTNASSSCENLILEILLLEETVAVDKMNLIVTTTEVDLSTPMYRLKLPLVHRVNVDHSHVQYMIEECKLILTLRLQRDLDFINF